MDITFDFATRDDCLDNMVPSDLRKLVCERDSAEAEVIRLREEVRRLLSSGNEDITDASPEYGPGGPFKDADSLPRK